METLVEIRGLSRRFRNTVALDTVSLDIPKGGVFGLVGENGAGKTTLIKHILGLFRAQSGSVRVFGLDPVKHPANVLGRMGILSEDRDLPLWMRVDELMRYTATFYPSWDAAYATQLREMFALDPKKKIGALSQGQLAKAGLLTALAHRPEFLVLDEPSSGLDPVVRRDILEAIIVTVGQEGRTVLFSSHLLDEVERTADRVAMIRDGRIVLEGEMETIKEEHHRVVVRVRVEQKALPELPDVVSSRGKSPEWTVLSRGPVEVLRSAVEQEGAEIVEVDTPSLEEVFIAYTENPGSVAAAKSHETLEV